MMTKNIMTTKNLLLKLASIASACLCIMSCNPELLENGGEQEGGPVTLTAYMESADSKTVLDGKVSKWTGDEWIQIAGRNGNYWFNTQSTSHSATATFTYNGGN
jgi:hypothetical protein